MLKLKYIESEYNNTKNLCESIYEHTNTNRQNNRSRMIDSYMNDIIQIFVYLWDTHIPQNKSFSDRITFGRKNLNIVLN
jgi:hypothetical protein